MTELRRTPQNLRWKRKSFERTDETLKKESSRWLKIGEEEAKLVISGRRGGGTALATTK